MTYYGSDIGPAIALNALVLLVLGMLVILMFWSLIEILIKGGRKSKQYRKVVLDMFVSSKIRQIAAEDKLDLHTEYKTYLEWIKRKKKDSYPQDLDDAVESELIEKIEKDFEKKYAKTDKIVEKK